MDDRTEIIAKWLGAGSINVFGLPFAGKDTQGKLLAEMFNGVEISSGDILRHSQDNQELQRLLSAGEIIPSALFEEIVLPYFSNSEFQDKPLILSEVGRIEGEQQAVIRAAEGSGHPVKALILLRLSDEEVWRRFDVAKELRDRGERGDDHREVLQTRIDNYHEKVIPVIEYYHDKGLLIEIDGTLMREDVTDEILNSLANRASS